MLAQRKKCGGQGIALFAPFRLVYVAAGPGCVPPAVDRRLPVEQAHERVEGRGPPGAACARRPRATLCRRCCGHQGTRPSHPGPSPMLCANDGAAGRRLLLERVDRYERGEWLALLAAAQRARSTASRAEEDAEAALRQRREAACRLVCKGEISRARHLLTSGTLAPGDEATWEALTDPAKRPAEARTPVPDELLRCQPEEPARITARAIAQTLREARRGAAPGLCGARAEHFKLLLSDADGLELLMHAASVLAQARVPPAVAAALALARMTALQKPDGGVRGIATGDVFRRLVSRALAKTWASTFDDATRPYQPRVERPDSAWMPWSMRGVSKNRDQARAGVTWAFSAASASRIARNANTRARRMPARRKGGTSCKVGTGRRNSACRSIWSTSAHGRLPVTSGYPASVHPKLRCLSRSNVSRSTVWCCGRAQCLRSATASRVAPALCGQGGARAFG